MDWIIESQEVFAVNKPEHFGNHTHCEECSEYHSLLKTYDVNSISINEVEPSSDPFCFSSDEGIKYYMPALIKFCFNQKHFFFSQLLFHLEKDGEGNSLFLSCNKEQRTFISGFIAYFIEHYPEEIELNMCENEALKVYSIWSSA